MATPERAFASLDAGHRHVMHGALGRFLGRDGDWLHRRGLLQLGIGTERLYV